MNDSELLQAWATHRDEAAFAELVRRHLPLVHASARRQVRDLAVAQEVSQAVFLVLARKADSLTRKTLLSGWLLRTTRFVAARALRAQQRRTHHEAVAAMHPVTSESFACPEHWQAVEPHLDAALAALPARDRDAVVLRFLEGKPIRAVGEHLGVGEDAAKKRVSRAVGRLRTFLAGKGVVLSASALTGLLTQVPGNATPAGLASQIVATVTAQTASPLAVTLAAGAIRDWFSVRVRELLPWAAAALVLVVAGVRLMTTDTSDSVPREGHVTPVEIVANSPVETPSPVETAANGPQPGPAKILLNVRSESDNRPLQAEIGVGVWGARGRLESRNLRTDADGSAEVALDNPNLHDVYVNISAPGHVPIQAQWRRHELVDPILLYTCRLQLGQHLEGVVQDESGTPVADARICFTTHHRFRPDRQNIVFTLRDTSVISDEQGRFQTDQLPRLMDGGYARYSVTHPDFVREWVNLPNLKSMESPQSVVLKRGVLISGRVIGPDGTPVSHAEVRESFVSGGAERSIETGPDGTFALGPFAPGSEELHVSAEGFKRLERKILVAPDLAEVVLRIAYAEQAVNEGDPTLQSAQVIRMVGSVLDDRTGDPIPLFQVRLNQRQDVNFGRNDLRFLGDGHSGRFNWPVEVDQFPRFCLQVDAEGYEVATSDIRPATNRIQSFKFRLTPGGTVSGRVLSADGQPVAGASVGLNGYGFGVSLMETFGATFQNVPYTLTDSLGRFSLRKIPGTESLASVHERGFALAPLMGLSSPELILEPWGAIEGMVLTAGEPAANQPISLSSWLPDDDSSPRGVSQQRTATSDAQGRFRFDGIAPGPVALKRIYNFNRDGAGPVGEGPRLRVDVPAGDTVRVTLGTTGRPLIGRVALTRTVAGYDWRDDLQTLEESRSDDPRPTVHIAADTDFRKLNLALARREARIRKYFPAIQSDGSFRIDDVPPGSYTLYLRIRRPPNREVLIQEDMDREELGKLEVAVLVPESDSGGLTNPLDLGIITIPVK